MTKEEAKSCIGTIEMLQRLAYNIHGVMDVIDADNCEKIIKALEQEPRWILDSERLPEESGNYLVTYRYGDKVETQEAVYFEDEDECKWFDLTDIEITLAVIAWMPLPKPYKPQEIEEAADEQA